MGRSTNDKKNIKNSSKERNVRKNDDNKYIIDNNCYRNSCAINNV